MVVLANGFSVYHWGGTLFALDPAGASKWKIALPDGNPVIARPAAAPNSTVYARTRKTLVAISHEGALLFSTALPEPPDTLPQSALAPVALADSTVAFLLTQDTLRCLGLDGSQRWTFELPAGEPDGPLVGAGDGRVIVSTKRGIYAISSEGELAWTHVPPGR